MNSGTLEKPISMLTVGWRFGLWMAAATSVIGLISHFSGSYTLTEISDAMVRNGIITIAASWLAISAVLYLGLRRFREGNAGLMSLGEGLTLSLYIGLFSGLFMIPYHWIYASYLLPDVMTELGGMLEIEDIDDEDIEGVNAAVGFLTSPSFLAVSGFINRFLACAIFGFFTSLFVRKD